MAELPLSGGCLCGAVRYEVTETPGPALYCHCTRCQRRTGAAASAQARIDGSTLRVVEGERFVRGYRPPDGFEKLFCGECGSQLFSRNPDKPTDMSVRLGTFDEDPGVRPSWRPVRGLRRPMGADSGRRPAALRGKQARGVLGGARVAVSDPREATPATAARNAELATTLPLSDPRDAELARRGRIAPLPGPVAGPEGRTVWDPNAGGFLAADAPSEVNPSLWRQAQLNAEHGLFEVRRRRLPGARGSTSPTSRSSAGETGWIVIDAAHHRGDGPGRRSSSSTLTSASGRSPP